MNAPKGLRSGELAQLSGVSSDTIRHYERMGVLQQAPRTSAGYRIYGRDSIERVRLVRRALQLGFTLPELSEVLGVRDRGGAPCRRVLKMTEEKLRRLGREIKDLEGTQRYMQRLVREWRAKLAQSGCKTTSGSKALLLHSLADQKLPSQFTRPFKRRITS